VAVILVPYLVGGPDERAGIVQLNLGPHLPLPEGPQVRFLTNTGRRIDTVTLTQWRKAVFRIRDPGWKKIGFEIRIRSNPCRRITGS